MATSKVNPNAKLDLPTTNPYQRIRSSKRINNNLDPLVDGTTLQHSCKSIKHKDKYEISKPESGSEEVYTTPSTNEQTKVSSSMPEKQRARQTHGDDIRKDPNEDADEESIANYANTTTEHIHRFSTLVNNSAIGLQQQGMGDHYHTNMKQHKNRSKTNTGLHRKYQRLIEQHDLEITLDERNAYRWRIFMYLLTVVVLGFVSYRFLLALSPKPKKTFLEQLMDDLSTFFTP